MTILALSICTLLNFSFWGCVIFTVIFTVCMYWAIIYLKLKFAFDDEECEYIRSIMRKIISYKKTIRRLLYDAKYDTYGAHLQKCKNGRDRSRGAY